MKLNILFISIVLCTLFLGCEQNKYSGADTPSSIPKPKIDQKPVLLVTSKRIVYAGTRSKYDIQILSNGPQYYCEGTVLNSGNADAHNVELIFRNSGVSGNHGSSSIMLGTINANSTKDFRTDNWLRLEINGRLEEYDLSNPVFKSDELGGFPWEK